MGLRSGVAEALPVVEAEVKRLRWALATDMAEDNAEALDWPSNTLVPLTGNPRGMWHWGEALVKRHT